MQIIIFIKKRKFIFCNGLILLYLYETNKHIINMIKTQYSFIKISQNLIEESKFPMLGLFYYSNYFVITTKKFIVLHES